MVNVYRVIALAICLVFWWVVYCATVRSETRHMRTAAYCEKAQDEPGFTFAPCATRYPDRMIDL